MKVLKIRTLDKGYADPREVMLHACFQSLVDLIEEHMFDMIDWQWNEYHQHNYKEMMELYSWWVVKRPKRRDPLFDYHGPRPEIKTGVIRFDDPNLEGWHKACELSNKFEEDCNNEDKEMLHRLVNIREAMLT